MRSVLTLLVDPAGPSLDPSTADRARGALAAAGATAGPVDWLSPGVACDIPFEGIPEGDAESAVRAALDRAPVDLAAQPVDGRRKRLLIADMESTVIRQEMLDEIAAVAGIGPRIAEITRRAMNGELDFRAALAERLALLAGIPSQMIDDLQSTITLMPGAGALVATMRGAGARCLLVSGGFRVFTGPVAARLGFHAEQGNVLEITDGRLTGRAVEPILDKDAKLRALEAACADLGIGPADAVAVGDGANDLPMLLAAGLGVAFRAKPTVAAAARVRIDHADLTALLHLQGFRAAEIRPGP
jgi:phosphoserine phosphatase